MFSYVLRKFNQLEKGNLLLRGFSVMVTLNIDKIFNPQSVAIIDASDIEGSVGRALAKNISDLGYTGTVYFVNIREPEILGVKTYPHISEIPEPVDLAVIAMPAPSVPEIVEECGKAKVKGVIIISAGFKESGPEGKSLEEEIQKKAEKYGVRVVGPNCAGVINPRINLNATFLNVMPEPGKMAFISQSGALGSAIVDWDIQHNIGISKFASVGSMIDVDFGDLIDYLGTDPTTKSILMYVEGITKVRKFMSAARHFARTKPIIVLKSGKFSENAKAVASHTGSLSSEDDIYDAVFKRAGIVRVDEIADLFSAAEVLSHEPLPKGPKLAIVTNSGGASVIATDALITQGGQLAALNQKTIDLLNGVLPPFWSKGNPIDLQDDAKAEYYRLAVEVCLNDKNIDGILVIFAKQAISESVKVAKNIVEIVKNRTYLDKTIIISLMGTLEEAQDIFKTINIPTYTTPEQAIKAYMFMYRYQQNIELLYETPEELPVDTSPSKRPIMVLMQNAVSNGREELNEIESKKILSYYNFPVAKTEVARNADEAVAYAKQLGFPVMLKILSTQTDNSKDGDFPPLKSEAEVREAYDVLFKKAAESDVDVNSIEVTIQSMFKEKGCKLMAKGKNDPVFGPLLIFGMGGLGSKLFKDYSIGLPPLNTTLIRRMMERTKVYRILRSYKNNSPFSMKRLEETLLLLSQFLIDFPQVKDISIDPLVVTEKDLCILDARIIVDKEKVHQKIEPHEHIIISPYPKKYVINWQLKNGKEVILRPIKPEDEPLWLDFLRSLSEESLKYRFFEIIKNISHEVAVRYCNIDYDREIAIVAEITEEGKKKLLGVARLGIEPDGKNSEIAFVLRDDWQSLGLGTKMVDYVLEIAKEMNVKSVYAIMMPDNNRALKLTKKMGFAFEYLSDGTVKGRLDLKNDIT